MKLIFVRHGHTNFNRFGIMNDNPKVNVHLTKLGKKQAEGAAEALKKTKLDYIYTSMLPRTFETATIINRYHNLDIQRDARINDNRTGFDGWHWVIYWVASKFVKDPLRKRFRRGESLEDSQKRVFDFIEEMKKKHDDQTVLVVGHANTGWIIKGYASKTPLEKMFRGHIVNGLPVEYDI